MGSDGDTLCHVPGPDGLATELAYTYQIFNALPGLAEISSNEVFYMHCHLVAKQYNTIYRFIIASILAGTLGLLS